MIKEFLLSVFHPDEGQYYIFKNYLDLKKWRGKDGYRYPIEEGGCCNYTYHTEYTQKRLKEATDRYKKYWENKEIENQRNKVWREQQKLNKMKEVKQ